MNLDYVVKPTDVRETLILPTIAQASMLESSFYGILKPYREGLYLHGELNPVLVPDQQYFTVQGFGRSAKFVPIADLTQVDSDIYNASGNKILSADIVKNSNKFLTHTPTIPARGVILLKAIVDYRISEYSQWMATGSYERAIFNCFQDELHETLDVDTICYMVQYTVIQLQQFMDQDNWNHYFTNIKGFDIIVEKCEDYRVCEWYEKKKLGVW